MNRIRKSEDQVRYLQRLYWKTKGKCDRKYRKEAMAATGLSWLQIYKWFFDKNLRIQQAKNECPCYTQYSTQIFTITRHGREVGGPVPIFEIVKDESARMTAKKSVVA